MLCGIPLVLLVVGVGETPRHYIAELALVIWLSVQLIATLLWECVSCIKYDMCLIWSVFMLFYNYRV